MVAKRLSLVCLIVVTLVSFARLSNSETLFFDDFEDGVADAAWEFILGNWVEENGILSQRDEAAGADPVKALLTDKDYPQELTIQAKVRIDAWADTNPARGGVAVRMEEGSGAGLNLVFRADPPGQVWFLNDLVAWGNSAPFDWAAGDWYYFQMKITAGDEIFGKVWAEGDAEPEDFIMEQLDWAGNRPDGFPGLNGGNNGSAVSFDDVEVWDAGGQSSGTTPVSSEKLATTWGLLKTPR